MAQTLTLAKNPTPALAPALGLLKMYTNVNLKKAIRLVSKLFIKGQKYSQAKPAPWNRAFKAQKSNLYYKNLYIKCYHFRQWYENYFDTAAAMSYSRIIFAALFPQDKINFRLKKHKT